jgi:myo-inositol-1(or 4)-monophosphatase
MKDALEKTLKTAGQLIMAQRMKYGEVTEKEKNEIVTPADILSNQFITAELIKLYPEIPIYTEEEAEHKSQANTRWILDPIDGTTPWAWGNSGFAISLALERDGEITIGAIYDPVMQEFFYAEKGRGATRNNELIKVAANTLRAEMLMVVDWGYKDEKRAEGLAYFKKFLLPDMFARRIVPQWAPALGFCRLAEGRIHAIVCNDTWQEDHAAGALIVREAGGVVTNFYHTDDFNPREFGVIAANNRANHMEIVNFLSEEL